MCLGGWAQRPPVFCHGEGTGSVLLLGITHTSFLEPGGRPLSYLFPVPDCGPSSQFLSTSHAISGTGWLPQAVTSGVLGSFPGASVLTITRLLFRIPFFFTLKGGYKPLQKQPELLTSGLFFQPLKYMFLDPIYEYGVLMWSEYLLQILTLKLFLNVGILKAVVFRGEVMGILASLMGICAFTWLQGGCGPSPWRDSQKTSSWRQKSGLFRL